MANFQVLQAPNVMGTINQQSGMNSFMSSFNSGMNTISTVLSLKAMSANKREATLPQYDDVVGSNSDYSRNFNRKIYEQSVQSMSNTREPQVWKPSEFNMSNAALAPLQPATQRFPSTMTLNNTGGY